MSDKPLMAIRCPVCQKINGQHKMDCQAEAYSEQFIRRIAELEAKIALIEAKFKSGNSVLVERVTITRSEWEEKGDG